MAKTWHPFYGGYLRSGPFNNVVLCGSPDDYGPFSTPLKKAHQAGYGKGIGFENDGFNVSMALDLVGVSVRDNGSIIMDSGSYVVNSGTYHWIFKIEVSTNGGSSYSTTFEQRIFSHPWQYTKIYSIAGTNDIYGQYNQHSWDTLARASQYSRNFTLSENTTHVKFSIRGENSVFPYEIIFPIEKIIPDYRPFAVRKSNVFRSCNNTTGFLRVRKSGTFTNVKKISFGDAGKENKGTSRLRVSSKWLAQKKRGS